MFKPRIPDDLARDFTMMSEGDDTPASRIAVPLELALAAGIPVATEHSLQLDPVVHECIRLYNANYNGCTYCQNARQAVAVQAGLTEDIVEKLRYYEDSELPPNIRAALRIAAMVAAGPMMLTDAIFDEARKYFSEQEIIDIVLLSCFTQGSRVGVMLGVEPGKEASSRLFYPSDDVYGNSHELRDAIEKLRVRGVAVEPAGPGHDPIGTVPRAAPSAPGVSADQVTSS